MYAGYNSYIRGSNKNMKRSPTKDSTHRWLLSAVICGVNQGRQLKCKQFFVDWYTHVELPWSECLNSLLEAKVTFMLISRKNSILVPQAWNSELLWLHWTSLWERFCKSWLQLKDRRHSSLNLNVGPLKSETIMTIFAQFFLQAKLLPKQTSSQVDFVSHLALCQISWQISSGSSKISWES